MLKRGVEPPEGGRCDGGSFVKGKSHMVTRAWPRGGRPVWPHRPAQWLFCPMTEGGLVIVHGQHLWDHKASSPTIW